MAGDAWDDKPDVTSADYLAGVKAGRLEGQAKARREVMDKLARFAAEVKAGRHRLNALQALRVAWRRIDPYR